MIYSYCWIFCERNEDCCLKVMKTLFFFSAALISQFKVSNLFKTLLRTVSVVQPTAVWAILLRSISIFDINVVHFLTSFCSEIDHLEVRFNMLNQSSKGFWKTIYLNMWLKYWRVLIRELIASLINVMSENEDNSGEFANFKKCFATKYLPQLYSSVTFLFDEFCENNNQDS